MMTVSSRGQAVAENTPSPEVGRSSSARVGEGLLRGSAPEGWVTGDGKEGRHPRQKRKSEAGNCRMLWRSSKEPSVAFGVGRIV